jgi:predicted TIM-barrel fold metal-dependent hydrolase
VGVVAAAFPRLSVGVCHGYWPKVQEEVIGIAFCHVNVHLVPDMYVFQPGRESYVKAANGFLADQFPFGSFYPFRSIRQSIDDYAVAGFRDDVLERVFHANAVRLLGL